MLAGGWWAGTSTAAVGMVVPSARVMAKDVILPTEKSPSSKALSKMLIWREAMPLVPGTRLERQAVHSAKSKLPRWAEMQSTA